MLTLRALKTALRAMSSDKNQTAPVIFVCPNPQCQQTSAVTDVRWNGEPMQDATTGAWHRTGAIQLESRGP